jgi:hypothetical protein
MISISQCWPVDARATPRLGRPLGVTTPVNDTVVGIIRVRERRMLASMVTQ